MNPEQRAAYTALHASGGKIIRFAGGHAVWSVQGRAFSLPHHASAWKGHRAVVYAIKVRVFLRRLSTGKI